MKIKEVGRMALVEIPLQEKEILKKKLTLTSKSKNPFTLKLYEETKEGLLIPRCLVPYQSLPERGKTLNNYEFKAVLRPEQAKIVEDCHELLKDNYGVIIKAPTGTGKTIIGLKLAFDLGYRTLVVVPTDRIMSQWVDSLKTFSNLDKIGIIRQHEVDFKSPVVIGMIHTLARRAPVWKEKNEFGTVIFDENHLIGAETFSRVAPLFNCKVRIGLSATPRRKDGMDSVFLWHIGPILYGDLEKIQPKVCIVEYYDLATHHKGCVWNGEFILGRYLNKIANNQYRNKLLADLILKAYDKGHHVLLLVDRLSIIRHVEQFIRQKTSDVGFVTGSHKDINHKIILGTYGSAGLGLDIPQLSCLILGTPRTDIEQAVGRILRKKEGKLSPVVIDVVDISSFIMSKWHKVRLAYYKKYAHKIDIIKVNKGV